MAHELFSVLPWNAALLDHSTTFQLTRLLGNQWMSDTIMDLMMECLVRRLEHKASTYRATTLLLDTSFPIVIQKAPPARISQGST